MNVEPTAEVIDEMAKTMRDYKMIKKLKHDKLETTLRLCSDKEEERFVIYLSELSLSDLKEVVLNYAKDTAPGVIDRYGNFATLELVNRGYKLVMIPKIEKC